MLNEIKHDFLPYSLAVITLIGFIYVSMNLIPPGDADMVKLVLAAFIAWMGSIIGFYFGNKPVGELTTEVKTMSGEVVKQKKIAEEDTENLETVLKDYRELKQKAELLSNYVKDLTK